jgi:hypothetical protein
VERIEFESGAEFIIGPACDGEGDGIPTVMTREEVVDLMVALGAMISNSSEELFMIELPFVLHSPN